jgi:hypothetical protein
MCKSFVYPWVLHMYICVSIGWIEATWLAQNIKDKSENLSRVHLAHVETTWLTHNIKNTRENSNRGNLAPKTWRTVKKTWLEVAWLGQNIENLSKASQGHFEAASKPVRGHLARADHRQNSSKLKEDSARVHFEATSRQLGLRTRLEAASGPLGSRNLVFH